MLCFTETQDIKNDTTFYEDVKKSKVNVPILMVRHLHGGNADTKRRERYF